MIASAQTIRKLKLIEPLHERQKAFGMTYGLGPAGYDVRVEFDDVGHTDILRIPANNKVKCVSTIEYFKMPNNLLGLVGDKSTWARQGLFVQNTRIEPNWEGYLTVELTNQGEHDIYLKRGMPIAQITFHFLDEPTEIPYDGKYQYQRRGPQQAILES